MKVWQATLSVLIIVVLLIWFGSMCSGCYYGQDAAHTVFDETKASTFLKRYQWFKDAAAQLDARAASIKVYEQRFDRLKKEYEGKPRSQWAREDREQANLWEQEMAGIRSSFNNLAASYNAAMAKENWRYANVGDLPRGADQPMPREFKLYLEK